MNLNGVIALILRYFTEFDRLEGRFVTVVEERPIRFSAEYPVLVMSWPVHAIVARSKLLK